jgi:hypothetical protein
MESLPETQQQKLEQTAELIRRAKTGDPTAMPEIRELLKNVPSLCHAVGDVAASALIAWIRRFAGEDLIQAETIGQVVDQLRDQLTEPGDGPLEKLIVEQLLVTHVQVHYRSTILGQTDCTHVPTLRHLEQQLDQATRRFTHLVKMLELLRKSKRKTTSPKTVVPTAKQNGRPLVPEPLLPTFAVNNRIRELVAEVT